MSKPKSQHAGNRLEAAVPRCSSKYAILEILQYSQETPVLEPVSKNVALKFFIQRGLQFYSL